MRSTETEQQVVDEEDDRVELCYTPEQIAIRAMVDAMDERVSHPNESSSHITN